MLQVPDTQMASLGRRTSLRPLHRQQPRRMARLHRALGNALLW